METNNFLSDHVHVSGPIRFVFRIVLRTIAERSNVVRQGIKPYVDHVFWIVRNRNAPRKAGAADGKITQAGAHESDDLVTARLGTNKVGLARVKLQQLIRKGRELKEVILLFDGLRRASAFRTWLAPPHLHVNLVEQTIPARIAALVDVTVVPNPLPEFLKAALVPVGSGADVVVISDAHPLPQCAELRGYFVGELLRSFSCSFGGPLDFLSVLVGASQEESIHAHHALTARNCVACNRCVRMPNMRTRIDVINRGRDVKLFRHDVLA